MECRYFFDDLHLRFLRMVKFTLSGVEEVFCMHKWMMKATGSVALPALFHPGGPSDSFAEGRSARVAMLVQRNWGGIGLVYAVILSVVIHNQAMEDGWANGSQPY